MKTLHIYSIMISYLILSLLISACGTDETTPSNTPTSGGDEWAIPQSEVFDGGPGKDGIPALENPEVVTASEVAYLSDDDLVLGYKNGNEVIAYPHPILDWHEIINDQSGDHAFAVTYCPLTGTGIGWNREIDGDVTTFGVSGLLYNTNLIPYDRKTDSNWSQMRLDCVNGTLKGTRIETFALVETTWKTWKSMYSSTKVVSTNTGHSRNYERYPYGDYKTNNSNILFPYSPKDDRLDEKERVHGIIVDGAAKAYRFETFGGTTKLVEDDFNGEPVVVVGNEERNFIISFKRTLGDGTVLDFSVASEQDGSSPSAIILEDNEGNKWNVFGEAVSGPRAGQNLESTNSFLGYWFSWGAFYPGIEIYDEGM